MKLTRSRLREIIKEELNYSTNETTESLNEGFLAVVGGIVISGMLLSAISKLALGALKNKKLKPEQLHKVLNDQIADIIKNTDMSKDGLKSFESDVKIPVQKRIDNLGLKSIREMETYMRMLVALQMNKG